jgi:hypothetical protein
MEAVRPHLHDIIPHPDPKYKLAMSLVFQLIETRIDSVAFISIISAFVRSAPALNLEGFDDLISSTIAKEVDVHNRTRKGQQLNYTAITTLGYHRTTPIHRNPYLYAPSVSLMYCEWLHDWKSELHSRIFYPQFGNKFIGRISDTRARLSMVSKGYDYMDEKRCSTLDLYYHYFREGIRTTGPCEVQWAFKYNDVKPRVFYRNGSDAYWGSLYIHDLIDDMMSAFPHTAARTRYNVQRIEIGYGDAILLIYDYETFTSSLEELRYYLTAIAQTIKGVEIFLWDAREGLVAYDAGQLLEDYVNTCCVDCEYDLGEILGSDSPLVHLANLAGLLGVFGNINASLSLHGLVLCHICKTPSKCTCIGDDALGVIRRHNDSSITGKEIKRSVLQAVKTIGNLSLAKTIHYNVDRSRFSIEQSEDDPSVNEVHNWHYVKRPINCADYTIHQGYLHDLPLPYLLCSNTDSARTVQKPSQIYELRKEFVNAYCSFLDQLKDCPLSQWDKDIYESYIFGGYKILGIRPSGYMPSKSNPEGLQYLVTPPADQNIFGTDWREYCWINREQEFFILELADTYDETPFDLIDKDPPLGYSFRAKMHPSFVFYVKAGLLRAKETFVDVLIGPYEKARYDSWLHGRRSVYEFTVDDYLPSIWLDACLMNPVPRYTYVYDIEDF